jgi:hypothetical protein
VSFQRQAEYRSYSERIAYYNTRVAAFSQYLLTDDLPREGVSADLRYSGFESGLRTSNGKAKPSLEGFRLPLVAKASKGSSKVTLWGIARPAKGATKVTVQQHDAGHSWRTLATVTTNSRGVWTRRAARGGVKREWRVRWTDASGKQDTGPATRAMT